MRRAGAKVSIVLGMALALSVSALGATDSDAAPASAPYNFPVVWVKKAALTANDEAAPSEQLRLFDAPTPMARIAMPVRDATPPAASACPDRGAADFIERAYGLRPGLLDLVVSRESAGHLRARSPKGARGLMQVMPATAARWGVAPERLEDRLVNLATGAAELRRLELRFNGDLGLALAGYNAGEAAVARHGGRIPPYPETRAYVTAILQRLADPAAEPCDLGRRS